MFAMFVMFLLSSYLIYLSIQYLRGFQPYVRVFLFYPPKIMKGKIFSSAKVVLIFLTCVFLRAFALSQSYLQKHRTWEHGEHTN